LLQNMLAVAPKSPKAGSAHFILGRIHENRREWEKARDRFRTVAIYHSASPFFEQAHFKTGWMSYLMGDDKAAQEWLEYDRSYSRSSYMQAKDDYWLARLFERQKKTKEADSFKDEIRRAAPLS
ncbi:MAG: tetratricopeptide repeat protein, partial [Pseudomonadota bacterium]